LLVGQSHPTDKYGQFTNFLKLREKYNCSFTFVKVTLTILVGIGIKNGSSFGIRFGATNGLVLEVGRDPNFAGTKS
jgi:hypothetical protein